MRFNKKNILSSLFIIAVTVIALIAIFSFADKEAIFRSLLHADFQYLAGAIIFLMLYQFFRALRLKTIMQKRGSISQLFAGITFQGAVNNLLPAGLGEIILIWIVRRFLGSNLGGSIATILVARIFDVGILSFSALLLMISAHHHFPVYIQFAALVLLVGALISYAMLFCLSFHNHLIRKKILNIQCLRRLRINIYHMSKAVRSIDSTAQLASIFSLTIAMWSSFYLTYVLVVRALNINLTVTEVLIIYLLSFPAQLIPIKTVGNIGIFEGIWVIILATLGWNEREALTVAITAHLGIIGVLIITVFIVLAFTALSQIYRNKKL